MDYNYRNGADGQGMPKIFDISNNLRWKEKGLYISNEILQ